MREFKLGDKVEFIITTYKNGQFNTLRKFGVIKMIWDYGNKMMNNYYIDVENITYCVNAPSITRITEGLKEWEE